MKIIEQSHEILEQPHVTSQIPGFIEKIARTCYQSEGKIKEGSASALCRKLVSRKHDAMLEHVVITIIIPFNLIESYKTTLSADIRKYMWYSLVKNEFTVSASIRTWRRIVQEESSPKFYWLAQDILSRLPDFNFDFNISKEYDLLKKIGFKYFIVNQNNLKIIFSPLELVKHRFFTVKFITNRGVTHELVRHRPASFAQESTRYVKYDGDMEIIRPVFEWAQCNIAEELSMGSGSHLLYDWYDGCEYSEKQYQSMIKHEASPQEAREVLPNALKAEIVVTANVREWIHILTLRTSQAAHPQIRELMIPLLKELRKEVPILFDHIEAGKPHLYGENNK